MSQWQIVQEEKKKVTLRNPLLIEGLPGIANVGKIAVDFLIEEFKAKKGLMYFDEYFKGILKQIDAKRKKKKV